MPTKHLGMGIIKAGGEVVGTFTRAQLDYDVKKGGAHSAKIAMPRADLALRASPLVLTDFEFVKNPKPSPRKADDTVTWERYHEGDLMALFLKPDIQGEVELEGKGHKYARGTDYLLDARRGIVLAAADRAEEGAEVNARYDYLEKGTILRLGREGNIYPSMRLEFVEKKDAGKRISISFPRAMAEASDTQIMPDCVVARNLVIEAVRGDNKKGPVAEITEETIPEGEDA